jgi:hypothetical protein
MTDIEFTQAWTGLEPAADARLRIQARLLADLAAHDTSLLAEWLGLLRIAPFRTLGLGALSAVAIAAPLAWLAATVVG